ncbi:MAG: class I SAM-dependent methyltransferase [Bacteroidetes bacterium]|nr:class I SAM-dependent methyltransferase [Bacteroidota bacterium]
MYKELGEQCRKPSGLFGRVVSIMLDINNKKDYEKMITELALKKGDRIFEIGYGPGQGIRMIARGPVECTIGGIDFSELMYSKATKRNKKFKRKGIVKLKYGDIESAERDNERFDKIFCVNVIYFWSDLNKVFEKIYSMLDEGGGFYIFMTSAEDLSKMKFSQNFFKYSIETVESALLKAGFGNVGYKLDTGYVIKAIK